ncbi:MAG TPA: helix-turn-helix transcriptional regulator [Solirubrobacteraceae bacterium]|nr:helix-turn-helix transcriptional regulator [Solirubrobacteraceae bacterium]
MLPQGGPYRLGTRTGPDRDGLPQRLAALRNERRMTQGTLAQHVGIHVSRFRRYEGVSSSPTLDVLRKLAIRSVRQLTYVRLRRRARLG